MIDDIVRETVLDERLDPAMVMWLMVYCIHAVSAALIVQDDVNVKLVCYAAFCQLGMTKRYSPLT